jgi:hypothetical protein
VRPLSPLWSQVGVALPPPYGGALRGTHPFGRVWKLVPEHGPPLALKLAAPGSGLSGEARTLAWLASRGAPVPRVLALDASDPPQWLALEWCGDRTLDDAAQTASEDERAALGLALAGAVAAVERAFAPLTAGVRSRPDGWKAKLRALRAQAAPWIEAAQGALAWLLGHPPPPETAAALGATLRLARDAPADAGSLDYNARNVVLGETPERTPGDPVAGSAPAGQQPGAPIIVDFAVAGVDWPARRFVQYGTATGTGRPPGDRAGATRTEGPAAGGHGGSTGRAPDTGTFQTVIDPGAVQAYAAAVAPLWERDAAAVARAVDAHDVLLLLTAAAGLASVAARTAHPERAAAWADVTGRRERLLALLHRRLVDGGPADAFRAHFR